MSNENDLHKDSSGEIKLKIDCFNEIEKNYPEDEAIRIGVNTTRYGNFKEILDNERAKKAITEGKNRDSRYDFSDLGIGEY